MTSEAKSRKKPKTASLCPADVHETQNLRRESSFRNRPVETGGGKCVRQTLQQTEREKSAHLAFQAGMASISNSFAVSRLTLLCVVKRARDLRVHASNRIFQPLQNFCSKSQRVEIVHQNQVYFSAMSVEQGIFCV
jgi:hypothetical protein